MFQSFIKNKPKVHLRISGYFCFVEEVNTRKPGERETLKQRVNAAIDAYFDNASNSKHGNL